MSSSHRLSLISEVKPEVRGVKATASEQHNGQQCRYVKRSEMRNVNGKERELFYWIRSCECGNEADHSDLLDVNSDNLDRSDGVEVHLKKDCEWIHPKSGNNNPSFLYDFKDRTEATVNP